MSVEDYLSVSKTRVNTFIVDPPRTGLSKPALEGVLRGRPERVVYVSCDPPTLARDARRLFDGGYALRSMPRIRSVPEYRARGIGRRICEDVTTLQHPRSTASARRLPRPCVGGGGDEFAEERQELARAPEVFRVPLHADAERARRAARSLRRCRRATTADTTNDGATHRRPGGGGCSPRQVSGDGDAAQQRRQPRPGMTWTSCANAILRHVTECVERRGRPPSGCPAPACRRRRRSAPARRGRWRTPARPRRAPRATAESRTRRAAARPRVVGCARLAVERRVDVEPAGQQHAVDRGRARRPGRRRCRARPARLRPPVPTRRSRPRASTA